MNINHALGLHMHQSPGNLKFMIGRNEFAAEQIIRCYERMVRRARQHAESGRFHVSFSGVLLEQLRDPDIINWCRQRGIDIPAVLDGYRKQENIELIGAGYYHPIFQLIPHEDWDDQLARGQRIMRDIFGCSARGFWPPEMSFCMEMVPALVNAGYEYVVIDGSYIEAEDDIYRPYSATYEDATIVVVPLERSVSYAQESGMDEKWFTGEVFQKVQKSPHPEEPRLVTTWSPGEGGGWFLQLDEDSGFFGHFLAPYLGAVGRGEIPIQPVLISKYIEAHPPTQEVQVRAGPWNSHWTGSSETQRAALEKISKVSASYWALKKRFEIFPDRVPSTLDEARTWILEAEASCFLVRGDGWIPKIYERTQRAEQLLANVESEAISWERANL